MSVVKNSVLKLLSDLSAAADNLVQEHTSDFSRLSEWAAIVRNSADSIVESGTSSSTDSPEIPNLTSFLRGRSQRGLRVSTVLSQMQKKHLHGKGRASTKRTSRKSSIKKKTPIRRKSNLINERNSGGEDTPIYSPPETIDLTQSTSSSIGSVEKIIETPFGGGPYSKGATSKMDTHRKSKRKSSSPLSLEKAKKPKVVEQLSEPKERDKSIQNAKSVEKLTKAKSSYPPNIKSSGANTSVLKENRTLRSKMETKQEKAVENRKNILALRQQKLIQTQNKRTREEKQEIQGKMKLDKGKIDRVGVKLRSGGRVREKIVKISTHSKEASPKANVENETVGVITSKNSGKYKEKQTSSKKMPQMNFKKVGTSVSKSNEKTPAMKNSKHETEKTLNTTYVTQGHEPSTSGLKGKTFLKDPNIGNNSEIIKAVSSDNKMETLKKGVKTVKSLNEQKKQLVSTPKTQKKGPESYAITPARSSFVSYDISEIRSDSEDEEQSSNSKPIPSWATGVHLRNALLQQHHHPIDTDELFGNQFEPPDLVAIMGVKKKAYNKRTSSAVWNSSFV